MLSRFNHVWFFVTPRNVAHQAPLPMGFSRQEYWSGLPYPPPGDPPNLGIEPMSLMFSALAAGSLQLVQPGKPILYTRTLFLSILYIEAGFFTYRYIKVIYKCRWPRSLALQADSLPSEPPGKPYINLISANPDLPDHAAHNPLPRSNH